VSGAVYKCPECGGKCYWLTTVRVVGDPGDPAICRDCGSYFDIGYVRGYWAGYNKRDCEEREVSQ
jgi:hypothetical protein